MMLVQCANEYFSRTLLENRQYLIHIYTECFIESGAKCNYFPDLNDFNYRSGRKIDVNHIHLLHFSLA